MSGKIRTTNLGNRLIGRDEALSALVRVVGPGE